MDGGANLGRVVRKGLPQEGSLIRKLDGKEEESLCRSAGSCF